MPFPPGPFDPTYDSSFSNNSVSTTDREWFANLFNFSRVPWDVLFLFGLFTAIVGFLIAHWWLTQRMRKYKDRIRILDHEDTALESFYPKEGASFPSILEEVSRDSIPVRSKEGKQQVRFSDPISEEATSLPVQSVPIKTEPTSVSDPPTNTKDESVTIVPSPEPPTIVVQESEPASPSEKKGKKPPSRAKKAPSTKNRVQSEPVSEIATASDS